MAAPGLLVIDDEPSILHLLRLVASREGFSVWTASSGQEAVALFRRHHEAISLVLCDVRMRGLDGPATAARLLQIDSAVRLCFMSGYLEATSTEALLALGALRLFDKPFDMATLGQDLFKLATAVRAAVA